VTVSHAKGAPRKPRSYRACARQRPGDLLFDEPTSALDPIVIEYGVTDGIFIKPKKQQTEDYITGRFGENPRLAALATPLSGGRGKIGWRRRLESNQRGRRCKP
jgi:hypothetical protein